MKNQELRKTIIEDGTLTEYCKKRRELLNSGQLEQITAERFGLDEETFKECERARNCRNKQRQKIQDHINWLINKSPYDVYFATLTLNDHYINVSDKRQRDLLNEVLKQCADYIVNVDYGEKTDRKHYHAVVALMPGTYEKRVEIDEKGHRHIKIDLFDKYKMGHYGLEQIWNTEKDSELLAKYITKLTQHSIKVQQSYVSVKTGSEYQVQKKYRKRQLKHHEPYMIRFMEQQAELYSKSEQCPF